MSEFRKWTAEIEIRTAGNEVQIIGHAAVFNEVTVIAGFFRERIQPGAFANAIRHDDVPLLLEHSGLPLARSTAGRGTLLLSEDSIGLRTEAVLDASDPDVMRIVPKMKRGDLSKMSFAFSAVREEWEEVGDLPLRTLFDVSLYDVSIVTTPAYEGTDIGLRAASSRENSRLDQLPHGKRLESRYKPSEITYSFEKGGVVFNKIHGTKRWEVLGNLTKPQARAWALTLQKRSGSRAQEKPADLKRRLQMELLKRLGKKVAA